MKQTEIIKYLVLWIYTEKKLSPLLYAWDTLACARLCTDERKKQASSEITNERKKAGGENGRACMQLFKYLNLPSTSPTT